MQMALYIVSDLLNEWKTLSSSLLGQTHMQCLNFDLVCDTSSYKHQISLL